MSAFCLSVAKNSNHDKIRDDLEVGLQKIPAALSIRDDPRHPRLITLYWYSAQRRHGDSLVFR
jgi:hypothetical protein